MTEPDRMDPSVIDAPTTDAPTAKAPAADEPAAPRRQRGLDSRGRVKRTRAGTAWASAVALAVVTIAFVIFIVQNGQSVEINYLSFSGDLSAAAALLIAAVAGALLVGFPAAIRIGQLRRALRKNAKAVQD